MYVLAVFFCPFGTWQGTGDGRSRPGPSRPWHDPHHTGSTPESESIRTPGSAAYGARFFASSSTPPAPPLGREAASPAGPNRRGRKRVYDPEAPPPSLRQLSPRPVFARYRQGRPSPTVAKAGVSPDPPWSSAASAPGGLCNRPEFASAHTRKGCAKPIDPPAAPPGWVDPARGQPLRRAGRGPPAPGAGFWFVWTESNSGLDGVRRLRECAATFSPCIRMK